MHQLRDRLADLRRQFRENPERQQEILVTACNELQRGLGDLVSLEERFTEERERYEHGLEELVQRERDARATAEAAGALNDEFIATVSHELRTPLTAILGWTRVLQARQGDDPATRKALSSIERSAEIQAKLIEDLLDVSQMTLGRLRLDVKPLDLGTIVAGSVSVITPTATAKDVAVIAPAPSDVFIVLGDAMRLQQVFWNLLSNAVKFTPAGGTIQIDVLGKMSDVRVAVRDTGIGIEPQFLPHAFDRFRRGDTGPSRRYSGLGLGLAIVRQLVEAHGGTVAAESGGLGAGAAFTVVLPLEGRLDERRREPRLPFPDPEPLELGDALGPTDER